LFAFDEYYLPGANRRQQQLRAQIKDKPAQTFILAGRKWISGQTDTAGAPARIFYYQAFDPNVNRWIFDNGWQRTFSGETIASYQTFPVATFPEIKEQPGYFIKEDTPSDEMSYGELNNYIADLRQSGFDTIKLSVQLENKLAVGHL